MNHRILIVLDLEVIPNLGEPEKIGEPLALNPPVAKEEPANSAISGSGFYGNRAQQPPAQDRVLPSHSKPSSSTPHGNIYPIEGITPYANRWTIKARVTSKSDIKTWHKATGDGKLFSVNLLDESGEIKATGFNDQCDMLYDVLQEGSVYYISTCRVQLAKKQFSNLPNDYELTFERDSKVEKAEDSRDVPQVRFNFTNIKDLQNVEKESTIDIIAVVREVGQIDQIKSKTTQKPYDKRDLLLVDESGYSIKMTIWGKVATSFNEMMGTVIAFKGAKVSDFGGRSLSLLSSGSMVVTPDITEGHVLKAWFDLDGVTAKYETHANMSSVGTAGGRTDEAKTILQVKDDGLGMGETPDYFTLTASISYIKKDNFCYPACLSEGCNKKVEDMGDGTWRCEKCQINHNRPEYRYIMSLNVIDHTGQIWLSCFDEVGRTIMGMSANDLMARKDEGTEATVFENVICKTYAFKCRAKMDTYQDQQKYAYLNSARWV
jgi:replication factor A1